MKVCLIQPEYSADYTRIEELFQKQLELVEACDPSMDIIVLPEAADVPALAKTQEEFYGAIEKFHAPLMEACTRAAKRCNAVVFVSGYDPEYPNYRNTTFAIDREGNVVGKYFKEHLTPGETSKRHLDDEYSFCPNEPVVVTVDGLRYCFLTCYDFYFYENYARIARMRPDIIIGCSHQRSDTHRALVLMSQFLAYNTNTHVLRASVSMGADSPLGGCSCVVAPDASVLLNMESRIGMECVEFDPQNKYYKPAGYGNPPAAHFEYIEEGRRPWKYRPAGPFIVQPDWRMPYPRTCAHRGFNTVAPENSLPAFGAAVALGAQEIEFDLWPTKDGEIVSVHDRKLERVSTGCGLVDEHTYEELLAYDFGVKYGPEFEGLKILKFEEILKKFAGQVMMNIHIKTPNNTDPYDEGLLDKIVGLIRKYDCEKHIYFMSGNDTFLKQVKAKYPELCLCVGGGDDHWGIVDRAIAIGAQKVQLFKDDFDQAMVDKAHANGIICNVFYADTPEKARHYLEMGVDCILTNDYQRISAVVKEGF